MKVKVNVVLSLIVLLLMISGCDHDKNYYINNYDCTPCMLQDIPDEPVPTVPEPGTLTLVAIGTLIARKLRNRI